MKKILIAAILIGGILLLTAMGSAHNAPSQQVMPASPLPSANLYFNESGLPSGTSWTVSASGLDPYQEPVSQKTSSTSSQIEFASLFAQGTQVSYTITGSNGYQPSPSNGKVTLSGQNNYEVIDFAVPSGAVNLFINETGLPTGTPWSAYAYGYDAFDEPISQTFTVTSSSIEFASYFAASSIVHFNIYPAQDPSTSKIYNPAPSTGSIQLSGTNTQQSVSFSVASSNTNLLTVNIQGGLPYPDAGLQWTGFVYNNASGYYIPINIAATSISWLIPNGTYYFQINGSKGSYEPNQPNGYFTVQGTNYTINEKMQAVYTNLTYSVSFLAVGIPNGTHWNLTFNGTSHEYTANQQYIPVRLGYTYNISANASGYIYTGQKSAYLYTFSQQITIQFEKNQSSFRGYLLNSVLGTLGLSLQAFTSMLTLVIAGLGAWGIQRIYDRDPMFMLMPGVLVSWLMWVFLQSNVGIAVVLTVGVFAAFYYEKVHGGEGNEPAGGR